MTKVLIGVPTRSVSYSDFTRALLTVVAYAQAEGVECKLALESGTYIMEQRERMAYTALAGGYSHLFFLDDDMVVPAHTLSQLLGWSRPVAGANYVRRFPPFHPVTTNIVGNNRLEPVYTLPHSTGLEKVSMVGTGCLLIERDVFEVLPRPWFHAPYVNDRAPITAPDGKVLIEGNPGWISEDTYFCGGCHAHKIPVYVDHDLSKEVFHLGVKAYGHQDNAEWGLHEQAEA